MSTLAWPASRSVADSRAQPANTAAVWAAGFVAYALVCRFASFLFCGELMGIERAPFRPPDVFRWPVSIFEFPAHILVLGLVVGTWLLAPALVSYVAGRRWGLAYALLAVCLGPSFIGGVMLIAGAAAVDLPWTRRLLVERRLALGVLFPVLCVVLMAARTPSDPILMGSRLLLLLPVAIAGALGLSTAVWFPFWPVQPSARIKAFLALLMGPSALAVVIFRAGIGVEEVTYPVLERQWGLASGHFVDVPLAAVVGDLDRWDRDSVDELGGRRRSLESTMAGLLLLDYVDATKVDKVVRFRQFLRRFPDSRHAPRALYQLARTLDTRLVSDSVARHKFIEYDGAEVSKEGLKEWMRLADRYPDSPYAAVARVRIARYMLRDGDLASAAENLRVVERRFGSRADATLRDLDDWTRSRVVLDAGAAVDIERQRLLVLAVARGRALRRLLEANRSDQEALAALLRLRPRTATYGEDLALLAQRHADSSVGDDIELAQVLGIWDRRKRASGLDAFWQAHRSDELGEHALMELVRTMLACARWNPDTGRGRRTDLAQADQHVALFLKSYPHSPLAPMVKDLAGRIALAFRKARR